MNSAKFSSSAHVVVKGEKIECNKCHEDKSPDEFSIDVRLPTARHLTCRTCEGEKQKKKNMEKKEFREPFKAF